VVQDFPVHDGGTINIDTNAVRQDHFRIVDLCRDAYEHVFKMFPPFNKPGRGNFPFGRVPSIQATRNKFHRIDVVYPDQTPFAKLAFVEPVSAASGGPLIHIKHKAFDPGGGVVPDRRLFGVPDPVPDPAFPIPATVLPTEPTLIPHELAHALYFALMSTGTRASAELQYLQWIIGQVAAGQSPFHNTDVQTIPFVAWIECLGLLSERLFVFRRRHTPALTGMALCSGFINDELSGTPMLASYFAPGYVQVGSLNASGGIVPASGLTGDNVEGALYGGIFLDYGKRTSLAVAVGEYLSSSRHNVLKFDEFSPYIASVNTNHANELAHAATTWGL
jgi:hypothetical protein